MVISIFLDGWKMQNAIQFNGQNLISQSDEISCISYRWIDHQEEMAGSDLIREKDLGNPK